MYVGHEVQLRSAKRSVKIPLANGNDEAAAATNSHRDKHDGACHATNSALRRDIGEILRGNQGVDAQ